MTWLQFLSYATLVIQVVANLIVLSFLLPAFKRTRGRAFLLLAWAYLLGTFETICDYTIAKDPMDHTQYVIFHTIRRFTYFLVIGLSAAGIIQLVQHHTRRLPPVPPDTALGDGG